MSTTRVHGKVVFICDECGEGLNTEEKNFDEARKVYKNSGWSNVQDDKDRWFNLCPDCPDLSD